LNAWLGGFQNILNKMTASNFNWFLHAMLFIHTERVIIKQKQRSDDGEDDEDEDEDEDGTDIDREDD
jgi:hypothetical protein